jgi:hypothetical protein
MYACFLFAQDNYCDFNIHLVFSVLFRQVVKKEIKLEAVEDTINHRLMCNHPDHHSGKEMLKLQQKVDQLVGEAIAREKEIEKFTNELISQSQVTPLEKQDKLNIKDLNSCCYSGYCGRETKANS